jgi:hypothetical protein
MYENMERHRKRRPVSGIAECPIMTLEIFNKEIPGFL